MTGKTPMQFSTKTLPLLMAAMLSLLLSAFAAVPAMSQEVSPDQLALARKYIDLTDKAGLYESTVVNEGIKVYQQIIPQNPQIADQLNTAIGKVIETYKGRKGELFDQIARVYALNFTQQELQQIVDFYSSPTGQKLAQANTELNRSVSDVIKVFKNNLATEFFAKVRAELKAQGIDI